jgi:hypothetical protein
LLRIERADFPAESLPLFILHPARHGVISGAVPINRFKTMRNHTRRLIFCSGGFAAGFTLLIS